MNDIYFEINKPTSLLAFLQSFHLGRKAINDMIFSGAISVNGEVILQNQNLHANDFVMVEFQDGVDLKPYEKPLEIVFEDDDVLLVNKPPKLLVHTDGNTQLTLDNMVYAYFLSQGKNMLPRHAHRLDFDTSGIVIYAKHPLALASLSHQIEQQLVEKRYYAIIDGVIKPKSGMIELSIGKNRHKSNEYIVYEKGKPAKTSYQTLKTGNNQTLVDVNIHTGKTHQIRVHFSHLNHPVVGDAIYGQAKDRMMLHAYRVGFVHPRTMKNVVFSTLFPNDFTIKKD